MQLSTTTVPSEPSLAAIFPSGAAPSSTPGATADANAAGFAQLFPDLAPGAAPACGQKDPSVTNPATAAEVALVWTMTAPLPQPPAAPPMGSGATASTVGVVATDDAGEEPAATGGPAATVIGLPTSAPGKVVSFGGHHRGGSTPATGDKPPRKTSSQPVAANSPTVPDTGVTTLSITPPESSPAMANDGVSTSTATGAPRKSPGGTTAPAVATVRGARAIVTGGARIQAGDATATILSAGGAAEESVSSRPGTPVLPATTAAASRPVLAGEIHARYLTPVAQPPGAPRGPEATSDSSLTVGTVTSAEQKAPVPVATELTTDSAPAMSASVAPTPAPTASVPAAGVAPSPSVASHNDAGTSLGGRRENFAGPDSFPGLEKISVRSAPEKTFLSATGKRVTSGDSDLGTDVANSSSAMSAATFFSRPALVALLEHAPVAVTALAPVEAPVVNLPTVPADASSAAHRAVEAVLTAADRFGAGGHHAVSLQFSVGGADLTVRVELHADEVRTQFRTDSPELRTALAHEWQAVNGNGADRPVRLAAPVFASADGSQAAASSGDGAQHQRNRGSHRPADLELAAAASAGRATRFTARARDEFVSPAPRLPGSATTLHLHALA